MKSTWLENPAERPSFEDIVNDLKQSKIIITQLNYMYIFAIQVKNSFWNIYFIIIV